MGVRPTRPPGTLQAAGAAVPVLHAHGATACTDVTGFGLLGHLAEMARASGVRVAIDPTAVPLLQGALECARAGFLSSLHPENIRVVALLEGGLAGVDAAQLAVLVDPTTAGGLLASVPAQQAEQCVAALRAAGYERAAVVGRVVGVLSPGSSVCLQLAGDAGL